MRSVSFLRMGVGVKVGDVERFPSGPRSFSFLRLAFARLDYSMTPAAR